MIGAIVRKELRDQRPFAVLGVVLVLLDAVSEFLAVAPDKRPLSDTFGSSVANDGLEAVLVILAFSLGSGLLIRELDERTIELLDALPVRRWQLFAVKVLVALGALLILPVGETVLVLVLHALSRTSLDRGFHLDLLGGWLALTAIQLAVVLSVALLLSFLRRMGWLIVGVFFCLVLALRDSHPLWRLLDPTRLVEPHFAGGHWAWPTRALLVQVPIAGVALALSLALFSGWADRAYERVGRVLERGWVKWVLGLGVAATFVWAMSMIAGHSSPEHDKPPKERPYTFSASPVGHSATAHYEFSFLGTEEGRARQLIARADGIYQTVAGFLGVENSESISADLTGAPQQLAGTAHARSVRMSLRHGKVDAWVATLAHETTHTLARGIAETTSQRPTLGQLRIFNEGLATYVEHRFFEPEKVDEARFWVAALSARDQLRFEALISGSAYLEDHDDTIVYPVGERLVAAMVKRYGDHAPRRLLDAMARPDAPQHLSGLKLWLDTFQAAQMDLGVLADDLSRGAAADAKEQHARLAELTRPRGYLARDDEVELTVHAVLDHPLPEGWHVVCRFRPEKSAALEELVDADENEAGDFEVPPTMVVGDRVWVQLGVRDTRSSHALFEPWVQLDVPK